MNNKTYFTAYVLDGAQLLRYVFEHPIVEYWGEKDEQEKLKDYFEKNHYSHERPIVVEESGILDFMPFKGE